MDKILDLLNAVKAGNVAPETALLELKKQPFEDIGYAKIDHHRELRHGIPEVIFGESKTVEQIVGIIEHMRDSGYSCVMVTRLQPEKAAAINAAVPITYDPTSRIALFGHAEPPKSEGFIAVAAAGTSDLRVAEEAAQTAETLGARVERLYDVGVAGMHRLLARLDTLMAARVVIAVAGMEGALATVIGGLVSSPVIAVPTSVGYGANFGGLSALLSMLNSCAGNVSVVNIDNGFGAGYLASLINKIGEKPTN
ncbi:MAG: nickel pincer cofactor biosynthesis protein LarB [Oscillospiraceae bacterium]|jgi:NCAIR mutase (PurE)-related protein|nr:nickel pincer cofactor biosynthesis protein LarB [Oscillospiraceae bacterium]